MSGFMMSPVGVIVIAVYSFVILIVALIFSRLISSLRWRWILLAPPVLVLLSLPWAEEAWIAWHFNEACKDAGVHVYHKVEVDGFYSDMGGGGGLVENNGYRFVEYRKAIGKKIERVEKPAETLIFTPIDKPVARYHFRLSDPRQEVQIGWKLEKLETIVVDSITGELMGRDTRFNRYPNLADELLLGLLGQMQTRCEAPLDKPQTPKRIGQLYRYVLIPRKDN